MNICLTSVNSPGRSWTLQQHLLPNDILVMAKSNRKLAFYNPNLGYIFVQTSCTSSLGCIVTIHSSDSDGYGHNKWIHFIARDFASDIQNPAVLLCPCWQMRLLVWEASLEDAPRKSFRINNWWSGWMAKEMGHHLWQANSSLSFPRCLVVLSCCKQDWALSTSYLHVSGQGSSRVAVWYIYEPPSSLPSH
jgi:hypothetical protein